MTRDQSWPVFHLAMKCPCFQSLEKTERGNYEYVDRVCHEERYSDFQVVHGELTFSIRVCDHVRDSAMGFSCSEEVGEFLSQFYDNIVYDRNRSAVFAFARGFSHKYVWAYSVHGSCDNCHLFVQKAEDCFLLRSASEFIEGPGRHQLARASLFVIEKRIQQSWSPPIGTRKFCSASCAAEYIGAVCPTCGKHDQNTIVDRFKAHMKKISDRVGVYPAMVGWNFCSRQCCSLALDAYLRNEREERKRKQNLKCVREVQKVLSKAKAALRNRDSQEALQSLKKEFAQAANLP